MLNSILVYKGTTLAEKIAVVPAQVREKIEYLKKDGDQVTLNTASIILADLCGVLLGLRRSEFFASAEGKPNRTTLLCFRNLTIFFYCVQKEPFLRILKGPKSAPLFCPTVF